jgi:hypothetical protein
MPGIEPGAGEALLLEVEEKGKSSWMSRMGSIVEEGDWHFWQVTVERREPEKVWSGACQCMRRMGVRREMPLMA